MPPRYGSSYSIAAIIGGQFKLGMAGLLLPERNGCFIRIPQGSLSIKLLVFMRIMYIAIMKIKSVLPLFLLLLITNICRAQVIDFDTLKICTILEQPDYDKANGLKNGRWNYNSTLRVTFLDGDDFVKSKVQQFAQEWSNYCGIKFVFVNSGNAHIRISFKSTGSWSIIGRASEKSSVDNNGQVYNSSNGPSMNFGWFSPSTPDEEFSRVVLHEFGHALGLIHEHQSPVANISWDPKAVYAYYSSTQNWSKQQVDINIFKRYSKSEINGPIYDSQSIMHYAIPTNLVTKPSDAVGWNTILSEKDKSYIKTYYTPPSVTKKPPPKESASEKKGGSNTADKGSGGIN